LIPNSTHTIELVPCKSPRETSSEVSGPSSGELSPGELSRRDFLRAGCLACCASAAALAGLAGCGNDGEAESEAESEAKSEAKSKTKASNVEAVQPVENPKGVFLIAGAAQTPAAKALVFQTSAKQPIVVFQAKGKWQALSAKCTHSGCAVDWQPVGAAERFFCPCHSSRFDESGKVLGGPAKAPLPPYNVRVQNGDLVVTVA